MLNSDDFFIAEERKAQKEKAKRMSNKKEEVLARNAQESEAKTVTEKL